MKSKNSKQGAKKSNPEMVDSFGNDALSQNSNRIIPSAKASTSSGRFLYKKVLVPSLIVFLLFSVLYWVFWRSTPDTLNPRKGPIVEAVYALATVKSNQEYTVRFGIPSSVREIHVVEGDSVSPGELLVRTESTTFRSPISGVVTQVSAKKGDTVMAGTPVVLVRNISDRYLLVSLEQESILRIKKGQIAEISFENLRGETIHGKVTRIFPSNSQFYVRIDVENLPPSILPDMTADTAIQIEKRENAMLIPVAAIKSGTVKIIRNGKKQEVKVKVGVANGEWAEILDGIRMTDEIVLPRKK